MRNLLIKTIFAFASILSLSSVQLYSMNRAYNSLSSIASKVNPWHKEKQKKEQDLSILSQVVSTSDEYLDLLNVFLTIIETVYEGYPHLSLSPADAIKTIKLGKALEGLLKTNQSKLEIFINISNFEKALSKYFENYENLISKIKRQAGLEVKRIMPDISAHLAELINPEQNQKFKEETFRLLRLLVTYNLTDSQKITEEIQDMAQNKFDIELSEEQIKNCINLKELENIAKRIHQSQEYKDNVNSLALEFSRDFIQAVNKETLAKIFGCTQQELINFVNFDKLDKFIVDMLSGKKIHKQEIRNIINLPALETRFGLDANTLGNLLKDNIKSKEVFESGRRIVNLFSPERQAILKGAVLGLGGLTTLWLLAQGICPSLMDSVESSSLGYGLIATLSCSAGVLIWSKLLERVPQAQNHLNDIEKYYSYSQLAMILAKKFVPEK